MTQAQIDAQFDIVKSGKDYLCVPPVDLAISTMQREKPALPRDSYKRRVVVERASPRPLGPITALIWDALPATMAALVQQTDMEPAKVYTALSRLRREGKIRSEKVPLSCVVYHQVEDEG